MTTDEEMRYADVRPRKKSDREMPDTSEGKHTMRKELGSRLWDMALNTAGDRQSMEDMWSEWQTLYDGATHIPQRGNRSKDREGTEISVNVVRTKTDTLSAWLQNLTFPTGDKPWTINPTPVPELVNKAQQQTEGMVSREVRAPTTNEGMSPEQMQEGQVAKSVLEMARKNAEQMERILDDYLTECDFESEARMMIDQACLLGTGILKGPLDVTSDFRRGMEPRWAYDPETMEPYEVMADEVGGLDRPSVLMANVWDVYPDPQARCMKEAEYVFEKSVISRQDLLRLMSVPGYDAKAVKRAAARAQYGEHYEQNRGNEQRFYDKEGERSAETYVLWEYSGPVLFEEYCAVCDYLMAQAEGSEDDGDREYIDNVESDKEIERQSGMAYTNVVVRFVEGEVLSIARSDFRACELYHAFTPIPTLGLWGRGLPDTLGHLQRILNRLYRDVVSGSRSGSTTHLLVHENVEREEGSNDYDFVQVWRMPNGVEGTPGAPAFQVFSMEGKIKETLEALSLTRELIDDISGIPLISQGEQAGHITKTASGLGLLNDNAQITARRMVRMLDDQLIKPLIKSFYRWEMLYGEDPEAKGDYQIEPRGSSVLYSRQMQGEQIPMFYQTYFQDEDARSVIKISEVVRQHATVAGLPTDVILKTDEELQADEEALRQQPDPMQEAMAQEMALNEQKINNDYQAKMAKVQADMEGQKIDMKLGMMKIAAEERKAAAEMGRADTGTPPS